MLVQAQKQHYIRAVIKQFLKYFILLSGIPVVLLSPASGQTRILKRLMSNQKDSTRSSSFLPLPVLGYSPVTGWEFGVSALYSFYTDREDTLTRNSIIGGLASFTTKKQSNFLAKADIWSYQNKYHYLGEIRYKDFPFNFYGVGNRTREADLDTIDQALFRLKGEIEKLIKRRYYGGLNLRFENYNYKDLGVRGIYANTPALPGKAGGKVLFLGASQILDTRNTNTYTTRGTYFKLNYSYAPNFFGGNNFTGSYSKVDFRTFAGFNRKTVVGFNFVYESLQGNNTPFYLLPQLGNDEIMRGYYTGRYRNENLLAAQAEWRYRFIPRLGVAAFACTGNVYNTGGLKIQDFKPSYGAGFRYFFDVERAMSVRFDYAFGEKRPGEKIQKGLYISFGEAF